jgi:signal transduction histidine kinase
LTAILGYAKLLLDQQLGPLNTEQVKVIQRMHQGARRLRRLANSMLQASVGGQSLFRPRVVPGDMADTVMRAVAEATPLADARNVRLHTQITRAAAPLQFDPALIVQVLMNLLDNACRFTPKGGEITIRGFPVFWDRRALNLAEAGPHVERRSRRSEKSNAYRVEVRDTGPGIKPADRERVFNDYTSLDSQQEGDSSSHFGLGLATCRQIIDLHQGHIFVQPGEGGCFVFILPFAREEALGIPEPQTSTNRATIAEVLN